MGAGNALSQICEKKSRILLEENKYRKIILVVFLFSVSGMETSLFDCGFLKHIFARKQSTSIYRSRISSVGRALHCRGGGQRLDFWVRTNTQGLKITEE